MFSINSHTFKHSYDHSTFAKHNSTSRFSKALKKLLKTLYFRNTATWRSISEESAKNAATVTEDINKIQNFSPALFEHYKGSSTHIKAKVGGKKKDQ